MFLTPVRTKLNVAGDEQDLDSPPEHPTFFLAVESPDELTLIYL